MTFAVGDRIIGLGPDTNGSEGRYSYVAGQTGTITRPPSSGRDTLSITWDTAPGPFGDKHDSMYFWRVTKTVVLDDTRPITLRDGTLVTFIKVADEDRPYRATVHGLELSYDRRGRFYPHLDSPIDLVNK